MRGDFQNVLNQFLYPEVFIMSIMNIGFSSLSEMRNFNLEGEVAKFEIGSFI